MSSLIPLESSEVKESGQAIQNAQNTTIAVGTAATIVLIQELLKTLKLAKKAVDVEIKMNHSVAYKTNINNEKPNTIDSQNPTLSNDQVDYIREVVKLPVSNEATKSSIPLDKDVSITVDKKEVFSLKNGVVEKNLLNPQVQEKSVETPVSQQKNQTDFSYSESQVEFDGVEFDEVEFDGVEFDEAEFDGVEFDEAEFDGVEKSYAAPENLPVSQVEQSKKTPISTVEQGTTIIIPKVEQSSIPNAAFHPEYLSKLEEKTQQQSAFQVKQTVEKKVEVVIPKVKQTQQKPVSQVPQSQTSSISYAEVELVDRAEEVANVKSIPISFSDNQKEQLKKVGIEPQKVENAINENPSSSAPIIIVISREVEERIPKATFKDNLQSIGASFKNARKNIANKVSSVLTSMRERLFPASERNIKKDLNKDLNNIAVVNVASRLLDRFGSKNNKGTEIFEGNSFRLERSGKNLTVSSKDGRGDLVSLENGSLTGSLTKNDVEIFKAIDSKLNQSKSRSKESSMEMG